MKHPLPAVVSATLLATVALGCRPAKRPEMQSCRVLGNDTSDDAVKAAYAANHASLVVGENAIYLCGCGARNIGGASEQAKVGGSTEQNRLAGKTEENKLAGATEKREAGGATEKGQTGGGTEKREAGGATEKGQTGGGT